MAVSALSLSRGVHSNSWKDHFRLREGRLGHVELHVERTRRPPRIVGTSTKLLTSRNPWLESGNSRKGRVRSGTPVRASSHCKVDADLGDCSINFSYGKMLSEISSWGIGGPANMFVEITTPTEMASVLRFRV